MARKLVMDPVTGNKRYVDVPDAPTTKKKSKFAGAFNKIRKGIKKAAKGSQTTASKKGRELSAEIIGSEGLERLGDDPAVKAAEQMKKSMIGKMEEQTSRQKGLTSRFEKMADEGISPAEQQAIKTKMAQQMMRSQQEAGLRLGGALGGTQGASAAAQQRSLMAQGMQARAGIERDIFLASEAAKRSGLTGMGTALGAERAALAGEQGALGDYTTTLGGVRQFDIGQAAKERDIRLQTITGYEGMASAERMAKLQGEAAKAAVPRRQRLLGIF